MVDNLQERLEETAYERDSLQNALEDMIKKYEKSKKENEDQKNQIILMKTLTHSTSIKCEQVIKSSEAMHNFAKVSEKYRK